MHLPTPSLTTLRSAIRGLSTESAEKAAVQRVMDGAGNGHLWPQTAHGKIGSATVRVHIWPAVEGCRERVALIAGPSIRGDVRLLYPHAPGQPTGDLYIPATGRSPALTDAAPSRRNPSVPAGTSVPPAEWLRFHGDAIRRMVREKMPSDLREQARHARERAAWHRRGHDPGGRHAQFEEEAARVLDFAADCEGTLPPELSDRRNPDGGRESAGTDSSFAQLQRAVHGTASEQGQLNLVARVLAGKGYARAGHPEVHNTTIDRSTFRIYIWRDTPFGDHVLLATGPSFEPKLALASQVPAEPGVGVYVKAIVDKSAAAKRLTGGAERTATRATPKPTPAAEAAAERVARKVRAPKAKVLAAAAQVAEAEGSPTVQVKHVEEVDPEYAAEQAEAELPPMTPTERLGGIPARSAVDEAAAMREAADLIAALRKLRSAS